MVSNFYVYGPSWEVKLNETPVGLLYKYGSGDKNTELVYG